MPKQSGEGRHAKHSALDSVHIYFLAPEPVSGNTASWNSTSLLPTHRSLPLADHLLYRSLLTETVRGSMPFGE